MVTWLWNRPPGSPVASETKFGWILTGKTEGPTIPTTVAAHHVTTDSGDDLLCKFWEIEECLLSYITLHKNALTLLFATFLQIMKGMKMVNCRIIAMKSSGKIIW